MARSTFFTSFSITHAFEIAVFSTARSVTLLLKTSNGSSAVAEV
jgi:hypothetical protein